MDPRINPYAPGAGTIPPELAGRGDLLEKADIELTRCQSGLAHRGLMLVGLRGVGKTVLLNRIALEAEAKRFIVLSMEAPENRSLPALIIPILRAALLKLDKIAAAGERVKQSFRILGGFVNAMKLKYHDVEFQIDMEKEVGADTGDLEHDLAVLLVSIGQAAKEKNTALLLVIDELQYLENEQFAALITALHKCTQKQLPITLVAAGLPLIAQAGRAKSYAERLFEYYEVGALDENASKEAIQAPANKMNVNFTEEALAAIYLETQGYPYFLQEWGKHCWQAADQSPVTLEHVKLASQLALLELDAGFFRVRFDRLTPAEKRYLRAMAALGEGAYRSKEIADILQQKVQTVAPVRAKLISKGMIYSPMHGENYFTVPLFADFMKRVMLSLT